MLVAGQVAITSVVVPESIPAGGVTLAGVAEPLQYLPHYLDLLNVPPQSDYVFYTIHEGKIKCRDSASQIPAATALTVYGNIIPTVGQVPDTLVDDLVDTGVTIVREAITPPQGVSA